VFAVESRNRTLQQLLKVEEKTCAITPDKMDRAARGRIFGVVEIPYPLSEEEATPTVPESEKNHSL